jgi:DNA-directed RNA polymerase specialized sigma24 family protein
MSASELRPLRKKSPKGVLYTRRKETEETLLELLMLTDDALLTRCAISSPEIVGYVPSECLVYLVRTAHGATIRIQELIFKILAERIIHRLPRRSASDEANVSLTNSNIADKVLHLYLTMFMADRQNYDEHLDPCEVCFDKILKRRRLDAERFILRRNKRCSILEINDSTGEVIEELQKHGGSVQANSLRDIERNALLSDVDEAIEQLPDLQRQILHLDRCGYPMYSEDSQTSCISKMLKKSDKTVRSHYQQAITTLQSILNGKKIS